MAPYNYYIIGTLPAQLQLTITSLTIIFHDYRP